MASPRPTLARIQRVIAEHVDRDALTIHVIAGELHTSRSQLQRFLTFHRTTFTAELRTARVTRAVECLTVKGMSAARTAREVGLSGDHLRVLLRQDTGVSPRDIIRARTLRQTITAQHAQEILPRSGTREYDKRRSAWIKLEAEVERLLRDLPESPLSPWADETRAATKRPDFRARVQRRDVDYRRRAADDAFVRKLQETLDWVRAKSGPEKTSMSSSVDPSET